jgi:hypothetical protein
MTTITATATATTISTVSTVGTASTASSPTSPTRPRLRELLLDLARHEDDLAADELAATPYWACAPTSALGHRDAAAALRAAADLLLPGANGR